MGIQTERTEEDEAREFRRKALIELSGNFPCASFTVEEWVLVAKLHGFHPQPALNDDELNRLYHKFSDVAQMLAESARS